MEFLSMFGSFFVLSMETPIHYLYMIYITHETFITHIPFIMSLV